MNYMLEDKSKGALTLSSYNYMSLKVGWIKPLIFPFFWRDVTQSH